MEILEILLTISIILIAPIASAIIYRMYKLPKNFADLLQSKEDIFDKQISRYENEILELKKKNDNLETKLSDLSTYLHIVADLNALVNGDGDITHYIKRYIIVYEDLKKDNLIRKGIRDDVFVGRTGTLVNQSEYDFFIKIGFIYVDKEQCKIFITEKGRIFGEFYPAKFS